MKRAFLAALLIAATASAQSGPPTSGAYPPTGPVVSGGGGFTPGDDVDAGNLAVRSGTTGPALTTPDDLAGVPAAGGGTTPAATYRYVLQAFTAGQGGAISTPVNVVLGSIGHVTITFTDDGSTPGYWLYRSNDAGATWSFTTLDPEDGAGWSDDGTASYSGAAAPAGGTDRRWKIDQWGDLYGISLTIPAIPDTSAITITYSNTGYSHVALDAVQSDIKIARVFTGGLWTEMRTYTADVTVDTVVTDYLMLVDTTAGNVTVTLPPSDTFGRILIIKKIAAANTLTIARNGEKIEGATSDLAVTTNGQATQLMWSGTAFGWAKLN